MINVAVVFGGESCEHDVSIITGVQFMNNCDRLKYNIIPIYIDEVGEWYTGNNLFDLDNYKDDLGKLKKCTFVANDKFLYYKCGNKLKKILEIDVCVLCLHGVNGEDGCVSGILELSKIPYTASGVCCSSVCMDKSVFKCFCLGLGVDVVNGITVKQKDYYLDRDMCVCNISNLDYPVIIKPSRQGSSIGIEVCRTVEELDEKLKNAFCYDDKVLVEKFLSVKKEVNIALFIDNNNLVLSNSEEPVRCCEILGFDQKYMSNGGFESIKRVVPADVSGDVLDKIKCVAKNVYYQLDAFGVVRFDFIIDNDDKVYLNEVNTIPGSMANYLFDKNKYTYKSFIDSLIASAFIRHNKKLKYKPYSSNILQNGMMGIKK
jgi:D-alanine-D-alanine ligase